LAERIRVVVGLGNPGSRYERTRHNIGFRLIDRLGRDLEAGPSRDEGAYQVSWAELGNQRIALIKPMVFMNRSGHALLRFPESAVAGPEGHLVVLDDVWLPFGATRFRREGSAGGHNGLASVLESLDTEEVPRLRLGVGGAETEEDLSEYVLEPFAEEEEKAIDEWMQNVSKGAQVFLAEGPDAAMNLYNG
jgi:PTH1 family peptidyl-tRNA hydrolase